ncbi:hypothetical protein [Xanthobacter aminoxidans]|uniref:Uncharacterized protein n=1 Tax=Xanthobacter aminoxidans TaxID=186280 RepID=A0ABW6Z9W8_9HYPH
MTLAHSDIATIRLASEAVTEAFMAAHRDGGKHMAVAVAVNCLSSAAHLLLGAVGREVTAEELRTLAGEIEAYEPAVKQEPSEAP